MEAKNNREDLNHCEGGMSRLSMSIGRYLPWPKLSSLLNVRRDDLTATHAKG
jgi:hypothetical protein